MPSAEGDAPPLERTVGSLIWLYSGFLFTGSATVLLGLMLPRLAAQHHLSYSQSGTLLFTQSVMSALGAVFVRRRFKVILLRGYLLMGAAALALTFSRGLPAVAAIGVFGLGLGLAMTSISRLVGDLFPHSRGAAFSILNCFWSIGAAIAAPVVAALPGTAGPSLVCLPVAALCGGLSLATLICHLPARAVEPSAKSTAERHLPIIIHFTVIACLYVGIESTLGGWMSMWAIHVTGWHFAAGNLTAGCFWSALLLGRALTPALLRIVREPKLHAFAAVGVVLGTILLLLAHSPALLLLGASCAGLALAPVYPLILSRFLAIAGESRNASWVFIGGFGGAVFPWLTGVLSSHSHSLRTGLLVALAASVAMLAGSVPMFRALPPARSGIARAESGYG